MKTIKLKKITLENFKGIKNLSVDFSERTTIKGRNAVGKTTIVDGVSWLLFNRNSNGETNFQVRPLDANGIQIDFVDIKVAALFYVDGSEIELTKTQKQNWVKHRGELEKRFEGNVNTYEVDGYPKTEKEYKKIISELIDEEVFKLITNPTTFPNMPWKDQRNILMRFVDGFSDKDIASKNPMFADLLIELDKADSTDDIKAKYLKAKKELNKQLVELPARIDEVSKMKVDFDAAELELIKKQIEAEIEEIEAELNADSDSKLEDLRGELLKIDFEINSIYQKANDELIHKKRDLKQKIESIDLSRRLSNESIQKLESLVDSCNEQIMNSAKKRDELGKEYHAIAAEVFDESSWVFDENDTICSLCGQKLPEEKIAELKVSFEEKKNNAKSLFENDKKLRMNILVSSGNRLKADEERLSEQAKDYGLRIESEKANKTNYENELLGLNKTLSLLPDVVDMKSNATYMSYLADKERIEKQIGELENAAMSNRVDYMDRNEAKNALERELEEVIVKLQKVANNVQIDERINALEEEQKDIAQRISDQERMIYLLDEFIKEKMNVISNEINKHFKLVKFNLFKTYQNGGIEPCCEVTYNSIPFSVLNAGHRIVAGLDIINSLCDLYDIAAPCFIDNAESINDDNIPATVNQLVLLEVTEDSEMKVEV